MLGNLWTGLKLALLFPRADTKTVRTGDGAIWTGFLILFLANIFYSWLYLPGPLGGFTGEGFAPLGLLAALVFFGLFALDWLLPGQQNRKMAVLFLNAHIWLNLFSSVGWYYTQERFPDFSGNLWTGAFCLWHFVVFYKIVLTETPGSGLRELAAAALFAAVFTGPFLYFDPPNFLYAKDDTTRATALNAEDVFGRQQELLDKAFAAIKPSEPGHRDFYAISVDPDGDQDVFRKEALFAHEAFDKNSGTRGRSLVLSDSPKTVSTLPAATLTNLDATLQRLGKMIQPDEDALILYLTSHGSDDATLETALPGISLHDFNGPSLRRILDRSRFKWRVIVISACYSGSFIEPLKNDSTLIITASSKDRNSFGCSDENDLTYFGEAFLKDALPGSRSLPEAYAKAAALIAAREKQEDITAPSQPQIYLGAAMKEYLNKKAR